MAEQRTRRGTGQVAGGPSDDRQRRSDQRWRSRRRRKKRDRERRRELRDERRAQLEAKQASAQQAAEAQAAAAAQPAAAPVVDVPIADLGRTERRMVASDRRRREGMRKGMRLLMAGTLVAVALGAGVTLRLLTTDAPEAAVPVVVGEGLADGVDRQPTILLVTAAEDSDSRSADSLVLLAYDRVTHDATALLIPVSTVTDIPGHGVLPIGDALAFGGPGLVVATVDNLLGVHVDAVADMTYRDWSGLFTRIGPVQVEVEDRLVARNEDGTGDVRFLAGTQQMDAAQAAEFLGFAVEGEAELSRLPRIQRLLVAEFKAMAADPATLQAVLGDGVPMVDTELDRSELTDLLLQVAVATLEDRLDVRVLPVRPIGSAGSDGYRPDDVRVEALVADRLAESIPSVDRVGRQLQILNGMGQPGIGQSIAEVLVPEGYRVVLTGNADDFDHEVTRIVIYRDSPEQIAIANEIKRLLGVGVIEVSRTPQSVVDVTIVVGRDYG